MEAEGIEEGDDSSKSGDDEEEDRRVLGRLEDISEDDFDAPDLDEQAAAVKK